MSNRPNSKWQGNENIEFINGEDSKTKSIKEIYWVIKETTGNGYSNISIPKSKHFINVKLTERDLYSQNNISVYNIISSMLMSIEWLMHLSKHIIVGSLV